EFGVADGVRTHDNRNHNPRLYQFTPIITVLFRLKTLLSLFQKDNIRTKFSISNLIIKNYFSELKKAVKDWVSMKQQTEDWISRDVDSSLF
ncbi:MAG: hypothetical protein VW580_03565, partial [Flavobacteriaceae bacterium]